MSETADYSIDPQMAKAMERMVEIAEEGKFEPLPLDPDPVEARVRMEAERAWWNQKLPEMAEIREEVFEGPNGPVPVRLLYPDVPRPAPVLVYFHGGGWVVGSLETHHRAMRYLALKSGCAVAAVDYRLAPEHKFPAPLEDCVASIDHVHANGAAWGLDPSKLAVGGDSAGANLALGAALSLRDRGDSPIRSLTLFYGCFDRDFEDESHTLFGDGSFGLSTDSMRWYWNHYLSDETDAANPYACPMKADLSGLPPTQLYPAGLDPLRDDSARMKELMEAAGVPVEYKLYPGVCHAFINLTRMVDQAHELIDDATAAIRRNLALG
ncbi:alpha/beta hydrolase fold domain-containing protein [Nisaea acidiphila]|uniref:Alpha/beta hydrolase fold domain-containing protein n=1 Tax=Nisaea acidiphila TaxID=1862145 RepID=A0A9J7AQN9_9PROT|nr:alpha/beta hydrolase fold domain-containing protein [Nisaea acidiphila]UUX49551.1 alpha/beta hydrolase fold domain-containing protein [Nisaea acidiphila]